MSKKAWGIVPLAAAGWAAVVACGAGSNGVSGTSALVATAPEPAGKNCPSGGTRIDVGQDSNSDGKLDANEITQTQYVCNGPSGNTLADGGAGGQFLIATSTEPAGANCTAGGVKIESGPDTNGNGTLDANEVTSTQYVCNGATVVGSTPAITVYDANAEVHGDTGVPVTAAQASITVPGSGSIVAVSTLDAFCESPAAGDGFDCAGSGPTAGIVAMTTTNALDVNDAGASNYDYFYLSPNVTSSITRTSVYDAPATGTYTVYLNAEAQTGQIGFFRPQITLVFIPH